MVFYYKFLGIENESDQNSIKLIDCYNSLIKDVKKDFKFTIKLENFLQVVRRINQFSTPGFEKGSVSLLQNVFGEKKLNIKDIDVTPTKNDVKESDAKMLKLIAENKGPDFTKIDHNQFKNVLLHIFNMLRKEGRIYKGFRTFEESISVLPKSTSASFPYFGKKGDSHIVNLVKKDYLKFFKESKTNKYLWKYPIVLFHRFQSQLKEVKGKIEKAIKIRQIQGAPFLIIALEVFFFKDFKEIFLKTFPNVTIGLTRVKVSQKIDVIRKNAFSSNRKIFCGDLSKCDASVSKSLMVSLYSTALQFISPYLWNKASFLIYYLINSPIISTEGNITVSKGSNPTGCWFTSIINSYCVIFVLNYFSLVVRGKFLSNDEYLVQGDDFVINIDDGEEKELKVIFENFDFRLHLQKSIISNFNQDIRFLGFDWNKNGEPDNDDFWVISKILYPERFIELGGPDRVIVRYISLIFQLKRSINLWNRFLKHDKYLQEKVWKSDKPEFFVLSKDGQLSINRIPMDRLLNLGWRMF